MKFKSPPWTEIDTVMFDMDGTLLDLHFDNFFWRDLVPETYAKIKSISKEEALAMITENYEKVEGTLDWYSVDYWSEQLEIDIPELKRSVAKRITVRPNARLFLSKLKNINKQLLLVTNAHPKTLEIKMQHARIFDSFDRIVSYHSLKIAKENHGFFEHLQSIEAYNPMRTILFDDTLPVLQQAKIEGLKYLWGIKKPDSQQAELVCREFPLVDDFEQCFPVLNNGL